MKELDRLIKQLKLHKPEIEDREFLRDSIINKITIRKRRFDYLFGWTEIIWLRRSLAFASILIVGVFIVQQLMVFNRIERLEKRMISFNTEKILEYQRENVIINSVLMEDEQATKLSDSINVSTDDLLNLIREYLELQDRYEEIIGSKLDERSNRSKQKL